MAGATIRALDVDGFDFDGFDFDSFDFDSFDFDSFDFDSFDFDSFDFDNFAGVVSFADFAGVAAFEGFAGVADVAPALPDAACFDDRDDVAGASGVADPGWFAVEAGLVWFSVALGLGATAGSAICRGDTIGCACAVAAAASAASSAVARQRIAMRNGSRPGGEANTPGPRAQGAVSWPGRAGARQHRPRRSERNTPAAPCPAVESWQTDRDVPRPLRRRLLRFE